MGFMIIKANKYIKVELDGQCHRIEAGEEATEFASAEQVVVFMETIPKVKHSKYTIEDVNTQKQYKYKNGMLIVKNRSNHGSQTRQYIYDKAEGRCELCGRKIPLPEMTIDHVVPLAMGGRDEIANLQCACQICNRVKDKLLPEEYADWVKESFEYQIRKRSRKSLRWMIAAWAVKGI